MADGYAWDPGQEWHSRFYPEDPETFDPAPQEEEEWHWLFYPEDPETVGLAPPQTTSGPEGPSVETAPPEGAVSPARPSIDPGLIPNRVQTTVRWARRHFTPAASLHRNAEEDLLLSRGMAALSLDPGMLLNQGIQDGYDIILMGVSSADYVPFPGRPHEFIVKFVGRGGVPVGITVTDPVRSVKEWLKPTPPETLSLDLLGAQVGKVLRDKEGRPATANRRYMDDNKTAVMSILVRRGEHVELQQQVTGGPAFTQGTFHRRAATPRLAEQVWGTAPDTNSRESNLDRSPPRDTPTAKRPRGDLRDDPSPGSTIVQAEGVNGERQQIAAQPAAPAPGKRMTGPLSAEEEETIKQCMGDGDTPAAIARRLGRSRATVRKAIKRIQGVATGERVTGPLSPEEETIIRQRIAEKYNPTEIADELGRAQSTVQSAIERLRREATGEQVTGPLSEDEEKIIRDRMDSYSLTDIAEHLNRAPATVYDGIKRLQTEAGATNDGLVSSTTMMLIDTDFC
ncbi:hypothetical protein ACCS93_38335 [Rhizobium ruizarguesonis]